MEEACLNDDTVLDFVASRLTGSARADVERHLGGCTLCSRLVAVAAGYLQVPPANNQQTTTPPTQPPLDVRAPSLPAGTLLRDTYKIIRLIGRGGMGEVYEATHARLPGRYAVKVLHQHAAADPKAMVRFRREAEITSDLRHPNIVAIIDFDYTPAGAPYLVMEYLEGRELARVIGDQAPLPLERVLAIVDEIASALAAVHRREIVHRDLKPQNIFLAPGEHAEDERVKLVDFGISKVRAASVALTGERVLLGTPQYMAPEQARGTGEVDARADQFSVATIVYEMLTGRLAFPGDRVEVVVYRIAHEEPPPLGPPWGPALAAVLARALSKQPADRFPSIQEFARSLRAAAEADRPVHLPGEVARTTQRHASSDADVPPTATPTGAGARLPARRRALIGTVGALAVAVLVAVPLLRWAQSRGHAAAAPPPRAAAEVAAPPKVTPPAPAPLSPEGAPKEDPTPAVAAAPPAQRAEVRKRVAATRATATKAAPKEPAPPPPATEATPVRGSKMGSLIDKL